jgi:hypothetical protein
MKTKEFSRIAITIDKDAQTKFNSQVRLKQRHINDLYQLVSKHITPPKKSALQGNFYNEFIEMFLAKYQSEFPPISVHKMLEAMEVNTTKIDELTKQIAAIDIELNEELQPPVMDFNIYTESEDQNKLYKTLERICKELASLHSQGVRIVPQNLQMGTSQALMYNWSEKRMTPNIRKVLGKERR